MKAGDSSKLGQMTVSVADLGLDKCGILKYCQFQTKQNESIRY